MTQQNIIFLLIGVVLGLLIAALIVVLFSHEVNPSHDFAEFKSRFYGSLETIYVKLILPGK